MAATQASRLFHARPSSLRLVREFVRAEAADWDAGTIIDDLVLAVSEAATNAIVHSASDAIEVSWRAEGELIEVEVRDRGMFRRQVPAPFDDGGRGIFVMIAVMDEVSIQEGNERRPGTVVRLRKRRSPDLARVVGAG